MPVAHQNGESQPRSLWRDALTYPLRGQGAWLIISGGATFWVLGIVSSFIPFGLGFIVTVLVGIYIAAYLWEVIGLSAGGRDELPDWPEFRNVLEDLFPPALMFLAAAIVSFGPAVLLSHSFPDQQWLYWAGVVWGAVYMPMALLAACLFDSGNGLSPHIVLPAIARIPGHYALIVASLLAVILLGDYSSRLGGYIPFLGGLMREVIGLYAMVVLMQLIGMTYHRHAAELGWFESQDEPENPKG